jgi:hypothetical protein
MIELVTVSVLSRTSYLLWRSETVVRPTSAPLGTAVSLSIYSDAQREDQLAAGAALFG